MKMPKMPEASSNAQAICLADSIRKEIVASVVADRKRRDTRKQNLLTEIHAVTKGKKMVMTRSK